jgi:hypothetical protein
MVNGGDRLTLNTDTSTFHLVTTAYSYGPSDMIENSDKIQVCQTYKEEKILSLERQLYGR